MMTKLFPYVAPFVAALVLTLILTPLVRELNRRLGMVDKPDPRRINKVPIPRGGGVALYLGVVLTSSALALWRSDLIVPELVGTYWKFVALGGFIVAIGYADDKFGLHPKVKLAGQVLVALLTWWWADLGFRNLWHSIPVWLDGLLTVFWITGAINAFNLIDGLDGLASGLALVATLGMAGALVFSSRAQQTPFCFALMGGLLGFLRYNWNPASVFLGDSGSMFIGYALATLALSLHAANSFLVSVGVPLLAMGIPIFDTSLAIVRRSIRHILKKEGKNSGSGEVMTADTDHLHHRILRAAGLNQRKAVLTLYACAAFLVLVGLAAVLLKSRSAGLWLVAFAVSAAIAFHDMSRVELFDAGVLLNRVVRARDISSRRRWARLTVPFYLVFDTFLLVLCYLLCLWALQLPITAAALRETMPIHIGATFLALAFFRTYVTIWARALASNFTRLFLACCLGSILGSVAIYYIPTLPTDHLLPMTVGYAILPFLSLMGLRLVRPLVRDLFYALDCRRLVAEKGISRILVYGSGLRYRAFRRELVRRTTDNRRIVVGLLDDDILLRNHYIGGIQVKGTLHEAPAIIAKMKIDAVVVAFEASEEKLKIIREILAPTGVTLTKFSCGEQAV